MRYHIPHSVEVVDLNEKIVLHYNKDYIELEGGSLALVREALPVLQNKGVSIETLANQTTLTLSEASELVELLDSRGLLVTLDDDVEIPDDIPPDRYHLEARTDPEFAQEAMERLNSRPAIAVPDRLTNVIDVEYEWPIIPHDELVVEDIDAFLVSLDYHNSPTRNLRYNEAALEHDFYFLPCRLFRSEFILGPLLVPGETTGFESAYRREKANGPNPERKLELDEMFEGNVQFPLTAEMRGLVSGAVVTEMKKILSKYYQPNTIDRTITVDFETLQTTSHDILRIPGGEQS